MLRDVYVHRTIFLPSSRLASYDKLDTLLSLCLSCQIVHFLNLQVSILHWFRTNIFLNYWLLKCNTKIIIGRIFYALINEKCTCRRVVSMLGKRINPNKLTIITYNSDIDKAFLIEFREKWVFSGRGCTCHSWLCEGTSAWGRNIWIFNFISYLNWMSYFADHDQYVIRELPSSPVPASCCKALLESCRKFVAHSV